MHLFVDISSHGFGHLSLSAPVLNALGRQCREAGLLLRLTLRSGLTEAKLRSRIDVPFTHIPEASDFGFVMRDSLRIDLEASAAAYRRAHEDWDGRVEREAEFLAKLAPDGVFSNVSYLPLAAAARTGIPALAHCSLNWADLFRHFCGDQVWAPPIHAQIVEAYRGAQTFLCPAPSMDMPDIGHTRSIGPIAAIGHRRRLFEDSARTLLVAMGGISHRLPIENWPDRPDVRWLVQSDWNCHHPRAVAWDTLGLSFTDALAAVDAVITKPGYGTFTEAACNGTPVLYQRREDWPEQEALIDWLHANGSCKEVPGERLLDGQVLDDLECLLAQPLKPPVAPTGAEEAAEIIRRTFSGA